MAMRPIQQTMAVIFTVLLVAPPTANAGPFGYDMGDPLPKLPESGDPLPIVQLVGEEAPTGFDALLIVGTPRTGICKMHPEPSEWEMRSAGSGICSHINRRLTSPPDPVILIVEIERPDEPESIPYHVKDRLQQFVRLDVPICN